jgi:hypothetical protein
MDAAVDICNDALAHVSQPYEIMSLDDPTEPARLCRRHFHPTMLEVLDAALWRCARRRVRLSPLAEGPEFGWAAQFQLPADFVRMVSFNGRDGSVSGPLFDREGRRLLANAREARVVYVRDVTVDGEPGLKDMDALLCKAAAIALAVKLALVYAPASPLSQKLEQALPLALRDARAANVFEAREPQIPAVDASSSDLLLSRTL